MINSFNLSELSLVLESLTIERKSKVLEQIRRLYAIFQKIEPFLDKDRFQTVQRHFDKMYNVGMNKWIVVSSEDHPYVGTKGVGPCLVFCGRATTVGGEIFLGLCHSSAMVGQTIIDQINAAFLQNGCVQNTIEYDVIGGEWPSMNVKEGSVEDELEVLENYQEWNVRSVHFNFVSVSTESIDVILSPSEIFYGHNTSFPELEYEGKDGAGQDFEESSHLSDCSDSN